MSFVKIHKLSVKYGKFCAVNSISFEIPKGEIFGFIGPNGAGKTSTIKVLATLQKPAAGSGAVTIGKIDVAKYPQSARRLVGYMPDFFGLYDDLSVNEYMHFFAAAYQLPWNKRTKTVNDVLELTDLVAKRDSQVNDLSRGMKQRLGLARVLLHDPELLLLDEPASGLDPRARIEMRELLKELKKMGKTILISSHILPELSELCTRIGIIEQGKLIAEGSVEEIYKKLDVRKSIHIQISNISDELLNKIRNINGVLSAKTDIDRISVETDEILLPPENLNAELHRIGAKVKMFQPQPIDMESVFMRLTEGKVQ